MTDNNDILQAIDVAFEHIKARMDAMIADLEALRAELRDDLPANHPLANNN